MKITNKWDLPAPVVSTIDHVLSLYDKGAADYSVTELIGSPRRRQLTLRHDDEIVVDYTDYLYLFLGAAIHIICERGDQTNAIHEYRFFLKLPNGLTVSGAVDRTEEHKIIDYKVTGTYSFLLGEKWEWVAQLNVYVYGIKQEGLNIVAADIQAILRDFVKRKARIDREYPRVGFQKQAITLWSDEQVLDYILERCRVHEEAAPLPDDQLPFCTDQEMWARPTSWAVIKLGNTRATKVLYSEVEALKKARQMMKRGKSKYGIQERPGERVRCEEYCHAAPFCNQHQEYLLKEAS